MEICTRCKRFKGNVKAHSAIHIIRNGKVEYSTTKYICNECERPVGKWSALKL